MKKVLFLSTFLIVFFSCNTDPATDTGTGTDADSNSTATESAESREERNKQTVLASIKGFDNKDVNVILKDVSNDITEYGEGSMPITKGVDTIRAGMQGWLNAMESISYNNLNAVADGDYVFVYGEWSGKYANDFMGMKTKGKSFKYHDVDIFKFNDEGKITEHRGIQSNMTAMAQMGVQPPKP